MKSKIKICPKCEIELGAKTRTCGDCGYVFKFKKIIKNAKKCPNCFIENRPRSKECSGCNFKFPQKRKGRYEEIKLWNQLKPGNQFILKKGSKGPYYQGKEQKILMAYRGHFTVKSIDSSGIVAYSQIDGFAYIYMGPNKFSESTGIYKRRYKLFKKI